MIRHCFTVCVQSLSEQGVKKDGIQRNVGSKSQTHERTNAIKMLRNIDDYLEWIQTALLSTKDIAPFHMPHIKENWEQSFVKSPNF